MLERIIQLMARTRDDFAALDGRFPVPSAADVRHAALTAEMLARMGCLAPEQLPGTLAAMVAIEQDVRQEIEDAYPAVRALSEFQAYRDAVAALQDSLRHGEDLDRLLNRQDAVAIAARELSEVVIQPPIADAGPDQTVVTPDDQTLVTLDASRSRTVGGREIQRYRWEEKR
jgi:hypothetical protein